MGVSVKLFKPMLKDSTSNQYSNPYAQDAQLID